MTQLQKAYLWVRWQYWRHCEIIRPADALATARSLLDRGAIF